MSGSEKPEGECTPTAEWGDLNQLVELAEKVRGDRTALREALKKLDSELTPSLAGAGVEAAYLAWRIQKYRPPRSDRGWWGIWYVPADSDNSSGSPSDAYGFYPLATIGDAPHAELIAFTEGEGAELMRRYVAALRGKASQISADVEKMEKVLKTLS